MRMEKDAAILQLKNYLHQSKRQDEQQLTSLQNKIDANEQ